MTTVQVYPFDHFATTEAGERWLAEVEVDFTGYDAVQLAASLEAVTNGVGGVFRIRIGGTSQQADGHQILEIAASASAQWTESIAFAARVVARGSQLFKLTAESATQDEVAEINAASLTLWAEATTAPAVFKMTGVDIWLGDVDGTGTPNTTVAAHRDWLLVGGRDAYSQSLRRRFATSPGEYKLKPDYGAGLRAAVKSRGRTTDIDDVKNRLRQQAMKDSRTRRVVDVSAEWVVNNGIKYSVVVEMVGDDNSPLTVSDTIPGGS